MHSVRAVPAERAADGGRLGAGQAAPLHVHLSEQVAENEACQAAYGCSPTELLSDAGVLGALTTAVHATHLSDARHRAARRQRARLPASVRRPSATWVTASGRRARCRRRDAALTLGSDSHAVIDPFEEMRALELDERLASQLRGHWSAAELLAAGTATGHASLGSPTPGGIEVGARADLVTLDLETPRTAGGGADLETAVFAASAADVVQVDLRRPGRRYAAEPARRRRGARGGDRQAWGHG